MTDTDRFDRPKPCNWCGEIFEHRSDCPNYRGPLPGSKKLVVPAHVKLVNITVYDKLLSVLKELTDKDKERFAYVDGYGYKCCTCCLTRFYGKEQHNEDCPILVGRKLLEQLK